MAMFQKRSKRSSSRRLPVSDEQARKILGNETFELVKKAQDESASEEKKIQAINKLVELNLGLSWKIVNRFKKFNFDPALDEDDFFQEGVIGLLKTVEKFDCQKGSRFSTYAWRWITQSILRSMENGNRIRIPAHIRAKIRKLLSLQIDNYLGHKPSNQEMQEALNWTDEEFETVGMALKTSKVVSLETPIASSGLKGSSNGSGKTLGSILISDADEKEKNCRREATIKRATEITVISSSIPVNAKYCILQRLFTDKSLEDIGKELGGVTRERARQLEKKALKYIKESSRLKHFRALLEEEDNPILAFHVLEKSQVTITSLLNNEGGSLLDQSYQSGNSSFEVFKKLDSIISKLQKGKSKRANAVK